MVERAAGLEMAGPDSALADFLTEHYPRLLGLARLVCGDVNDAADAVQVGLEQAWRGRGTFRADAPIRPWLDRIVVREAIRISKSRQSWLGRMLSPSRGVTWIDPPAPAGEPAMRVALQVAFEQLSPEQRAVVALHLHQGYTVAETAAIVSAPEETVRSRLRLARQRLRHELEESRS